ncbi:MAG: pentapeptide repeat-containing protein [Nitrospinaceae bacterium]|nr:pentapeptide repeat-containing protein [Nitrospinaceae bacterium]
MLPEWIVFIKEVEGKKPNLQGASLGNTKLMGVDLAGADLTEADLSIAYLIRADLREANLTNADLRGAVISEANLRGADLKGADLEDAFLSGTDLTGVSNLTCDQIELANFDKETRFPDYIQISWNTEKDFIVVRNGRACAVAKE